MGGRRRTRGAIAVAVVMVLLGACSGDDGDEAATTTTTVATTRPYAVGTNTLAVTRDAGGPRSFAATIFYPAEGADGGAPTPDAPLATRGKPYPLIVFAHGLGAGPDPYAALLARWAGAGYVVAAPSFPETSPNAPGGIDPGDYVSQPADVSAVVDAIDEETSGAGTTTQLGGAVDTDHVGVGGHSLGGITTLGVAANSCCRDDRIDAAVVMAGDPLKFPDGRFDYAQAPPLLLVHGTEDDLVTYEASVDVFNAAKTPKGLLTIRRGDHAAPMNPDGDAFASVVATTVDFFDAYLKDDPGAIARLRRDGSSATTRVVFVTAPGPGTTLPTAPPEPARRLTATATPDTGLTNGQIVTVTWKGFTPGKTVNIVQCSTRQTDGNAGACDLRKAKILQPNPTGDGSLPLEIVTGVVGTGICDADHDRCQIVVNDGGSLDPADSVGIPISFAP